MWPMSNMTGHASINVSMRGKSSCKRGQPWAIMLVVIASASLWVKNMSHPSVNSVSTTVTKNDVLEERKNGGTMTVHPLKEKHSSSTPSLVSGGGGNRYKSKKNRKHRRKSLSGGKQKESKPISDTEREKHRLQESLEKWMPGVEVGFEHVEPEMPSAGINADTISFLQDNFPECVLPSDSNGIINLTTMAAYRESSSFDPFGSKPSPRYDHVSCFVMKARYNCAHPLSNSSQRKVASDYELVLNMNPKVKGGGADSPQPCRLRQLFDEKNPSHMPWLRPPNAGSDVNSVKLLRPAGIKADSLGRYNVLIQGTSYLRQVWEAITCGFRNHITELKVLSSKLPPPLGQVISDQEFVRQGGCHDGCHGPRARKLYHPGVPHPPCLPTCNDDIAVVELDRTWRFYYIFRLNDKNPKHVQYIYDEIFDFARPLQQSQANQNISVPTGEDMHIEAAVVWNTRKGVDENGIPSIQKQGNTTTVGGKGHARVKPKRQLGMSQIYEYLKEMQKNDLGYYFGADNPWIYHAPDDHPCMPGIPDDEVNLIMFALLTGYQVISG